MCKSRQKTHNNFHKISLPSCFAVRWRGPEPLEELEQWIEEIGAKWDERLLRLKTWLEHEHTDS